MVKSTLIFVSVLIDTVILISIVATQLVLADIAGFGLDVDVGVRIDATLHDLMGLAIPLGVIVGASMAIAFAVAWFAHKKFGGNRTRWYMAAGFLSVPVGLLLLKVAMGVTLLAAARTPLGMFLVGLCGLAGGWLFAFLTDRFSGREMSHE